MERDWVLFQYIYWVYDFLYCAKHPIMSMYSTMYSTVTFPCIIISQLKMFKICFDGYSMVYHAFYTYVGYVLAQGTFLTFCKHEPSE